MWHRRENQATSLMFQLKYAWRAFRRNQSYSILNITGLAIALSVCLLIALFIYDELSFDRFHDKAERIYRVNTDVKFGNTISAQAIAAPAVASGLLREFSEVENVVRLLPVGRPVRIEKGDEIISEKNGLYADPELFDLFSFPMIQGNPHTALKHPRSMVVTESFARRHFLKSQSPAMSLNILNQKGESVSYIITGIIKDIPANSHIQFDFLLPLDEIAESRNPAFNALHPFRTYILLKPGTDPARLQSGFPGFLKSHISFYDGMIANGDYLRLSLIPLTKIHLYSNRMHELGANSSIQYVRIFSTVALLILVMACINFVNISTARFIDKGRQAALRKLFGSSRSLLIRKFFAETLILVLVAGLLAFAIAILCLPLLSELTARKYSLNQGLMQFIMPKFCGVILLTGIVSGIYPAIFFSSFKPMDAFKNLEIRGSKQNFLRRSLLVTQFVISIFLITGSMAVYQQLKFIHTKNMGFDRELVMIIKGFEAVDKNKANTLRQEVSVMPGVINATLSSLIPVGERRWINYISGANANLSAQFWPIDQYYLNTFEGLSEH